MARKIQFKRGTSAQNAAYTGADGEIVIVTDEGYALYIHDGVNAGGHKVSGAEWGEITGSLQSQTDLWNALLGKVGEDDLVDIDFGNITDSISSGTRTYNSALDGLMQKIIELRELHTEINTYLTQHNLSEYVQTADFNTELDEAYAIADAAVSGN